MPESARQDTPLSTIVREWGRIGTIGFGGPPAHIALFRALCVDERGWLTAHEFEDGIAATNLLPGPASTQLAIYCAWRLRGRLGAIVGGICFILPGLVLILALSAVFLAAHPPLAILGAAAGAGAAVPAVALNAARDLLPASWHRAGTERAANVRWTVYFLAGGVSAATIGPFLALVLIVCGGVEIAVRTRGAGPTRRELSSLLPMTALPVVTGGVAALCWVALKVGALSYGGGFVIIPLMQHDAVVTYHWMTGAQFLNAVALGQITPGPVVQTVAVVGYAASGVWGGLLAAAVAFAPSFVFIIAGAGHFDRLRTDPRVQAFFVGAGSAVIGAIAGSVIPLGLELGHLWQLGVLALAAFWLLALRRGVVPALLAAGAIGAVAVLVGAPS
ncbi:MAG: chromate efflux transporter [Acidimicrobiales bacterium]|jgi:chromate transporter